MNEFGGNWTSIKIEILVEYAKAYLQIMKDRKFFKLLYFDGFAGSGFIVKDKKIDVEATVGAAIRIVEINNPRPFDMYYFVELDPTNFESLYQCTKGNPNFAYKEIHVVNEDCNKKLLDLAIFLRKSENKNYRSLLYIDPCGMQLEWNSIEALSGLPIDMWILVPTGLGVNRLLTKNGKISEAWQKRLERFLGLNRMEIMKHFYTETATLFSDIIEMKKEEKAVSKSAQLYQNRLNEVFEYVSNPFVLRNSTNSIMYHLFLASNNKTAKKIGDYIVGKFS